MVIQSNAVDVIMCHGCVCFFKDEILEQVLTVLCLAANKELFSGYKERHLLTEPNNCASIVMQIVLEMLDWLLSNRL